MAVQRFRVWFAKADRVKFISHLDVLRFWERAIRRAELPLAYSQGFTPHPKIAFAGPLPLGFTSESELVDVTLDEIVAPDVFAAKIHSQATEDFRISRIEEIAPNAPAPQSVVLWSDYRVDIPDIAPDAATAAVRAFLAAETFPFTDDQREKPRTYDLRQSVPMLAVEPADGGTRVRMRTQTDREVTVRPELVIRALFGECTPGTICRTGILLDDVSPARDAWLGRGRYA